jgi:putative ABC transport system substrate-binding protein
MKSASILLSMALVAAPFASAAAQSAKTPRVGYVRTGDFYNDPYRDSFVRGMRELGWVADRNIAFEFRYYGDDHKAAAAVMADLVQANVAVIVAGGTPAIGAARAATQNIPIVMGAVSDPLGAGFIASLARPGGNITGLAILSVELTAKRWNCSRRSFPRRPGSRSCKTPTIRRTF